MSVEGNKSMHPDPAQLKQLAVLLSGGRYAELESRANALLNQYPDSGLIWEKYGMALQMQGKDSLQAFQRTAQLMPKDAGAHYNLGHVLKGLGRPDAAAASYRRATQIRPDFAEAHINLGNTLKALGQMDDAAASYRRALSIRPDLADAHNNLGIVLNETGQTKEALASFLEAVKIRPNHADAHYNLGKVYKELGQIDMAVEHYRRALYFKPDFAGAYNNLGNVFREIGQYDDALANYRRALQIKPDYAGAYNNLGTALKELGRLEEGIACYRRALEFKPDFAGAYSNLGLALKDIGQPDAAVENYRHALQIQPDYADAHNNLGLALNELCQFEAAAASYRRAIAIQPDYAEAHSNLGITLKDIGQHTAAEASYRHALQLKPDFADAQTNLLFTLNYTAHSPEECLAEARKYGQMVSSQAVRFSTWSCADNPERLRVGIVSGDLHVHPVGYFLESLLAHIDPARIELFAYPTDLQVDALTKRIQPYFSAWKPLYGLNDAAAAQLIHGDGVQILIDLSGHTGKNRLPVFGWKAAPVQASWLGYFATTGVAEMDYLVADETGVPEAQRNQFCETVWYLPDTRLCFTAPDSELPVSSLPALQNGHITFGCFQNLAKVGEEVLALWSKILRAIPGARLRWQSKQLGDAGVAAQFRARLQRQGIDPERVTLHGAVSRAEYLAAHAEVDMILDTFPYPGGTTTCEALWMGVPTLTLAGDTLLSRQGASLLAAAGLPEWIAADEYDYIAKAVAWADKLSELAALRAGLREQASHSALFDAKRFAKHFEEALWGMWQAGSPNH